jgi:hypothetical protein
MYSSSIARICARLTRTARATSCDILLATSIDCDHNGMPDECQPDCNGTASPICDTPSGTSASISITTHSGRVRDFKPSGNADAACVRRNGSAGSVQTLGEAFTHAINADTVLVANGLYQGQVIAIWISAVAIWCGAPAAGELRPRLPATGLRVLPAPT